MKKFLSITGNVLFVAMLIVIAALAFYVVKGKIDKDGVPRVAGHELYIVLSGSMNPVFDAGSVLAVKAVVSQDVKVGDIITFKDPEDQKKNITHRVFEVKEGNKGKSFITKGDANDAPDPKPVPEGNVIGKVSLWVPYAGYLLNFAKTQKGLLLIIIIPGTLFIITELIHLYKLLQQAEEEDKKKKSAVEKVTAANSEAGS